LFYLHRRKLHPAPQPGRSSSPPGPATTEMVVCWSEEKNFSNRGPAADASAAHSAQIRRSPRADRPRAGRQRSGSCRRSTRLWGGRCRSAVAHPGPARDHAEDSASHLSRPGPAGKRCDRWFRPRSTPCRTSCPGHRIDLLQGSLRRRCAGSRPTTRRTSSFTHSLLPFEGGQGPRRPGLITMSPRRPSNSVRRQTERCGKAQIVHESERGSKCVGLTAPLLQGLLAGQRGAVEASGSLNITRVV